MSNQKNKIGGVTLTINNIHRIVNVARDQIPRGVYPGCWSGYQVAFEVGDVKYVANVQEGVRGFAPVTVEVGDGGIGIVRDYSGRVDGKPPGRKANSQCDHPWHNNPGLVVPCPECGEGEE